MVHVSPFDVVATRVTPSPPSPHSLCGDSPDRRVGRNENDSLNLAMSRTFNGATPLSDSQSRDKVAALRIISPLGGAAHRRLPITLRRPHQPFLLTPPMEATGTIQTVTDDAVEPPDGFIFRNGARDSIVLACCVIPTAPTDELKHRHQGGCDIAPCGASSAISASFLATLAVLSSPLSTKLRPPPRQSSWLLPAPLST